MEVINFREPCSLYGRKAQAEIINLILSYYLRTCWKSACSGWGVVSLKKRDRGELRMVVWSCCLLRPFTWGSETRIHTGTLKAFGILESIQIFKYTCFLITPEMTFASVEQVSDLNSANFLRSARRVLDPSHIHENFPKLSPNTRKFGCSTNSRFKSNFCVLSRFSISALHTKLVWCRTWFIKMVGGGRKETGPLLP